MGQYGYFWRGRRTGELWDGDGGFAGPQAVNRACLACPVCDDGIRAG